MKIKFKNGGIIKLQPGGLMGLWQKAYDSKLGNVVRTTMFGKDYNLSDDEYQEKYGYAKPVVGTPMLPGKTSMNVFEGIEGPLVKGNFGTGAKYNAGKQIMETNKAAKIALKKSSELDRLNELALKWTNKRWDQLTKAEQYWLKLLKK